MIQFSDTTNLNGLIQKLEWALGFNDGGISDNSSLLAHFTGDINLAQDEVMALALKNNGWNVDDFNHTKDPFILTDLVSGQRDYRFTYDEQGNLILDIYKVMVADSSGKFSEIALTDIQRNPPSTMIDGQNTTGQPTCYDKTGNGILLDLIPNFDYTNGLKVFIDRETTKFTTTDTTKISGIDGLCHDYLYLKPAYEYARDKGLANREALYRDLLKAEQKVNSRYGVREKDAPRKMTPAPQDNR